MKRIVCILLLLMSALEPMSAQCTHPDFEGMMELYHKTNGDNWNVNLGWDLGALDLDCDPCDWYGVQCENGRVIQVLLNSNNLKGPLPDLSLSELVAFQFGNNQLTGEIPNFSGIPKLKYFGLKTNDLSGAIPNFNNIPELSFMDLESNNLSNALPDFSHVQNLKTLNLSGNQLEGQLIDFSMLPVLEDLDLSDNLLFGPIPTFEKSNLLQILDISNNDIKDTIPDLIHLSELESFSCSHSGMHGNFPKFSNNKKIEYIDISFNEIQGYLPLLSEIETLSIIADGNDLEGCYYYYDYVNPKSSYEGNSRMPFFGELLSEPVIEGFVGTRCSIPEFEKYRSFIDENCKCVIENCEEPHPDLRALLEIYHSTGGENWFDNSGWKAAAEGNRCDPCDEEFGAFYGVQCAQGRVICIDMDGSETCDFNGFGGNNLTGTWPEVHLESLRLLILDDNNLVGNLPDMSNLSNLRELRATNNNLTGEIPDFSTSSELTTLRLSYNNLTGIIPQERISDNIEFVTLTENNLSGCFPEWVCNLELFEADGNIAMPWQGDHELHCEGISQEMAPCMDALGNEGVINGCYCCEEPQSSGQEHKCLQSVYPNPAQTDLFISNIDNGRNCVIYNMKGQLVMEQRVKDGKIEVETLTSGVYFLTYQNLENAHVTHKFVKL